MRKGGSAISGDKAVVVAFRLDWAERAAALSSELASALGDTAVRIEHIGSTAVPAMSSKNILDFQVSVFDLDAAVVAFDAPLLGLGFVRSQYDRDHVPAGHGDSQENWVKRLWTRRGQRDGDVNLHVRLVGSPNERLALLFRDWFRTHPAAVPAYGAFKSALADAVSDSGVYAEVKDPIVDLVVEVAEQWATTVGWQA